VSLLGVKLAGSAELPQSLVIHAMFVDNVGLG
jgi:hypothetical protein